MAGLLCASLISAGFAVSSASSASDARDLIEVGSHDAILLDLGLPDGDGIDIIAALRAAGNEVPVLVLTARDSVPDRVIGLDAGADDYMGKPYETSELLARLRALLRRPGAVGGTVLDVGNVSVDCERHQVKIDGQIIHLAGRERELLEALMRSADQVVPKSELQRTIFGSSEKSTVSRLDVITHRLRTALETHGASTTIHTFRGVGYMLS
jgi:DNA-binding response OmpR family regulator